MRAATAWMLGVVLFVTQAGAQPWPINQGPYPTDPVSFSEVFGVQAETNCAEKVWSMQPYLNLPGNELNAGIANVPIENQCGEPMMVVDSVFEQNDGGTMLRAHIASANPTRGQSTQPFAWCDNGTPQECGFPPRAEGSTCCTGLPTEQVPWSHPHKDATYGRVLDQLNGNQIKFPLEVGGPGGNPLLLYDGGRNSPISYGSLNCSPNPPNLDVNLTGISVDNDLGYSLFENRWIGGIVAELDGADILAVREHHQAAITITWNAELIDSAFGKGPGGNNVGNFEIHAIYSDGSGNMWQSAPVRETSFGGPGACMKKRYEFGLPAIEGETRTLVGITVDSRPERVAIAWYDLELYPDSDNDGIDNYWDCDINNNGSPTIGQLCNWTDRLMVTSKLGTTDTCGLAEDLNGDCNVDADDVTRFDVLWKNRLGGFAKVPAPTL